ncbi:MDR family MFS transporter [Brevibacillus sp. B_LB10_24]|uniref:MDR family MFS transporter n=1 Tax=Brevibacillus sp. B_LB10_24 TaxID=3380645 RepID=UPI0038B93B2A
MRKEQDQTIATDEIQKIKVVPLLAVLLSGAFVAILNETLLNVAILPIMKAFGVEASTAQWLTTGYLLVVAVLVPVSAFLIQRYTTRQLFIASMSLFGIGTAIAGFAPVFAFLLLGRIIQAAGTGILIPLLMNVILAVIPPERRGRVMGVLGLVIMFAPAIGPTVSGLIIDYLSWRWLFLFVIPIAIISIWYGIVSLKNVTEVTNPKIDLLSMVLSTLGFGGIVFGFSSAGEGSGGWTDPIVFTTIAVGFVALLWFVIRQRHLETPMLDMRVFAYPMFSLAIVLMMIVMMTMFATMIVMPMFLLNVLAFSAVTVGLVMLPGGLINGAISPVMGYLFDKFGPRWLLLPGIVMMTLTVFLFRSLDSGATPVTIIILHSLLMVSVAMVMMPAQTNGLNQLPPHLYPHGAAIANTLMQVSGAIGTALFITIMTMGEQKFLAGIAQPSQAEKTAALAAGVEHSFTFGFALSLIALILAFFVRRVATTPAPDKGEGTL